jgi:hypothetical protein
VQDLGLELVDEPEHRIEHAAADATGVPNLVHVEISRTCGVNQRMRSTNLRRESTDVIVDALRVDPCRCLENGPAGSINPG